MAKVTEEEKARKSKASMKKGGKTNEEYKEAFDLFDKDGNGYITRDELATCVSYFGMTYDEKELDQHIKEYDQDGNGKIDFSEYLAVVSDPNRQKLPDKDDILAAFNVFDKNKDGFVNAMELSAAMKTLGNKMSAPEIKEMLVAADFNCDGKIDYKEFTIMMFT